MNRKPWTWRRVITVVLTVLAALFVLSLAWGAIGKAITHSVANATRPGGGGGSAVTCTFGANGEDVEVQFTNDATPCATQEQALASFGQVWYPISALTPVGSPGPADGETMGTTCVLTGNGSTITVEDAGEMFNGTQICSSNEQDGWENS